MIFSSENLDSTAEDGEHSTERSFEKKTIERWRRVAEQRKEVMEASELTDVELSEQLPVKEQSGASENSQKEKLKQGLPEDFDSYRYQLDFEEDFDLDTPSKTSSFISRLSAVGRKAFPGKVSWPTSSARMQSTLDASSQINLTEKSVQDEDGLYVEKKYSGKGLQVGYSEKKEAGADLQAVQNIARGLDQRGPSESLPKKAFTRDNIVNTSALDDVSMDLKLRRRFGGGVKSALGPGTVIEGCFKFDSPVRIDGTLTGNVESSSALIVGEQAIVEGDIKVGSLIVLGKVNGTIAASELLEICNSGRVEADVTTKRIAIEEGGVFLGGCNA